MLHFQFHFSGIPLSEQDQLIAILADNATGFEQEENDLFAYTGDEQLFKDSLADFPLYHFSIKQIEEQNWNQQWESSFEPVTIFSNDKPFVHIRASFHPAFKNSTHEIVITPKMSFGTGHHATTSLVVKNMKDIHFENKSVIDFGTGTGVLAILAEKCGASSLLAIDNDEWSINNARENFEVNGCSKFELVLAEEINCSEPVDVLIANINLNIILAHLSHMKECLKPNGILLLSGMLIEDSKVISENLRSLNFEEINIEHQQNWITVKAIRSN